MDSLNNPAAAGHFLNTAGVTHSSQHADANDAIEALETKVGVDGSAVATSLDYLAKIALPKGVLGRATVTASQTGIVGEVDLTGLFKAVTVGSGRLIRVSGQGSVRGNTTGDRVFGRIREGTTELGRWCDFYEPAGTAESVASGSVLLTPTAGAHTYKLTLERTAGTGAANLIAVSTAPAFILIEDLGLA